MSIIENTYASIEPERLDFLEQVEGGVSFYCDETDNPKRFIEETVRNILEGGGKHIVIYFRKTVAIKKARNIAKRIAIAVRVVDRSKQIETIYEVPTDLYRLLQQEHLYTDEERSAVIHAFLEHLEKLRSLLLDGTDMVDFLEKKFHAWDREWVEEVVNFDAAKEWSIPILVTADGINILNRLVEQLSRRLN